MKNVVHMPHHEEVEHLMRTVVHETVVPNRLPPLPEYVKHADGIDDVGRLTSEALTMSYESSAKRLEDMGASLLDEMKQCQQTALRMVKECENIMKETEDAVEQCKAAAQVYREQAKSVFEQIQQRSMIADKTRKTCSTMIDEIKNS